MKLQRTLVFFLACAMALQSAIGALEDGFKHPPDSARPWVYWFPLDGNISSNGITLDLEAMKRAGIGGVLYMETDQGAPRGPAGFGLPLWRNLFKHICAEANRLGIEVNMNNDAGWCGSGGPWITPELSMQRLVWTETNVTGPVLFEGALQKPKAVKDYYGDIAVFAFPTPPTRYTIPHLRGKSSDTREDSPLRASYPALTADALVVRDRIVNLTGKLDATGRLTWDAPAGSWTVLRLGHTTTGKDNHPAPIDGRGLECDKLSKEAAEAMFAGLMGKLIEDSKPLVGEGKTLVSTHIDSWEVGSQNWTPKFREEFQRLRGYDPLPLLPIMAGHVVDSLEVSERFLWDVRMTVNDLIMENYAGHFREMAHRHGMRLSIEAYDGSPTDDLTYGGRADEPMAEFWSWGKFGAAYSCTEMASSAHVYGRRILGAEAFTATDAEKWQGHPANVKDLGDWAFCEGINRFVFHRYALQPWTDTRPGMSMGPWGLHYERTQTWWEQSKAWHEYLARCQFLLQQGLFVADLCFLAPEMAPQRFKSPVKSGYDRPGYNFDGCPPEVVLTRMKVKDGRLVLPDGMSYRVLVLPRVETMTPQLLKKIKELVADGATVVGAPPTKSPSLSGYPKCDDEIQTLAQELWGKSAASPAGPGTQEVIRKLGKGRIIWGGEIAPVKNADMAAENPLAPAKWIWRQEGNPAAAAPPGKRYFRRVLELGPEARVQGARLAITADNTFQCWVNGRPAGSGEDFKRVFDLNVASLLKPGINIIAIEAVNTTALPNPAGLIAALTIKCRDGRRMEVHTDAEWEAATEAKGRWTTDPSAKEGWTAAMELGALGMEPWGDLESALASTDPIPDINVLCRFLAKQGVPPDFASHTKNAPDSLRYTHHVLGDTEFYFVANKNPQSEEAVCSFRVTGKQPELWWPDTGKIERVAVYDEAQGCTRVPVRFEPSGSVFVVFREKSAPARDRIVAVSRDGKTAITTAWKAPSRLDDDKNAAITNTFTFAVWVNPAADTLLPREANGGVVGLASPRNDALFPPPGHEVYPEDGQAGCGLAVGRNGVCVVEHGSEYFAPVLVFATPITNLTHVAVVYHEGRPSLYLNGRLAHQGLKGTLTVHSGVGVPHSRQVAPFQGEVGGFEQFPRALSESQIARLMKSMPKPTGRTQGDAIALTRAATGEFLAEATQPGTYVLKASIGQSREFKVDSIPAPVTVSGPWEVRFAAGWGAPERITLDKLVSWSEHPEAGVKYFSGAGTYRTAFQWNLPTATANLQPAIYLDLGKVAVMAEVKLNGKDLGILWKPPFRLEVTDTLKPGENTLEVKVVNLWINRQIGDEFLPEDCDRNGDGTLKAWPKWLEEGKSSPTGRFTFTSWKLWKKSDPLQESGLLGPVTLQITERCLLK